MIDVWCLRLRYYDYVMMFGWMVNIMSLWAFMVCEIIEDYVIKSDECIWV